MEGNLVDDVVEMNNTVYVLWNMEMLLCMRQQLIGWTVSLLL